MRAWSPVEPVGAGDKDDRVAGQCQDRVEGATVSFDMWQKPKAESKTKSVTESDLGKSQRSVG